MSTERRGTSDLSRESAESLFAALDKSPDDLAVRNALIEKYLSVVKHQAERMSSRVPNSVEFDTLVDDGVLGLIDAINAYDLRRGIKFETYCVPRVRGAMLDGIREMDWVPRLVRLNSGKIGKAERAFNQEHGRLPNDEELAEALFMTIEELATFRAENAVVTTEHYDRTVAETDFFKEKARKDFLEDEQQFTSEEIASDKEQLKELCRGFNRTERLIVIMYVKERIPLREVGESLGLSESRCSQMFSRIVSRIKTRFLSEVGTESFAAQMLESAGVRTVDLLEERDAQATMRDALGMTASGNNKSLIQFLWEDESSGLGEFRREKVNGNGEHLTTETDKSGQSPEDSEETAEVTEETHEEEQREVAQIDLSKSRISFDFG